MEEKTDKIYYIPIDDILPNRFQPRLAFDEKELNELANSILKYGVIQPIVLRKISDKYEIIAGERRYKAACLAGLKTIPAIINNTDDNTSAEIALLENIQRKNLTVIEEAQSYKKLLDRGFTQEDIANKLGVSQSSIANKIRLLNLPKEVRDALLYNQISERHARCLLTLNNEDLQKSVLNRIVNEKLTVKQTEDVINELLIKDRYSTQNTTTPIQFEQFLKPELVNEKKDVDEILDYSISPMVNINDFAEKEKNNGQNVEDNKEEINFTEIISNDTQINPFISNNIPNVEPQKEIKQQPVLEIIEIPQESTREEKLEIQKQDETKLDNLIINIKSYIHSIDLNNSIKTKELDLNDKYQIIIEIDKNAN